VSEKENKVEESFKSKTSVKERILSTKTESQKLLLKALNLISFCNELL